MRWLTVCLLVAGTTASANDSKLKSLRERTDELIGMLEVTAPPDPLLSPNFALELEVMRDFVKRHPEGRARFDKALRSLVTAHLRVRQLENTFAPRDRIDEHSRWRDQYYAELRALITDEPWRSLDWRRVFAERIARMEVHLAERLGVDLSRARELVEHALPTRDGHWGAYGFISALGDGRTPLYSARTLAVLYEEAGVISRAFAYTLRHANEGEFHRGALRRIIDLLIWRDPQFIMREGAARLRLARLDAGLEASEASPLRDAVWSEVKSCAAELATSSATYAEETP